MSSVNANTEKPMVYLGMPCYEGMSSSAARAYYMASTSKRFLVERQVAECSLLDAGNSGLWCWALNADYHGKPINYYAQIHSDVGAEDGWLDKLIDELEANDLDVLAALIPIKDDNGLTSTAIGSADLDPFGVVCRVTMREAFNLPMTFTAADLGHPDKPLLINTGCFVCRFDWRWAYACKFMSQTRIALDEKKKHWFAQSAPEDWEFGRCLAKVGVKVGVTRRVKVKHRGKYDFVNTMPWGRLHFDRLYTKEPTIRQVEQKDQFPYDVRGWLTEAEGTELSRLSAGKRVLEVGSYCGRSTVCIARTAERVVAVDPFDSRETTDEQTTLEEFVGNIERYEVSDRVSHFVGTFADLDAEKVGKFDFIFIDGDHSYEAVKADTEKALQMLAPEGIIAFHDYREYPGQHDGRWDPGVTQWVKEFIESGAGKMVATCDSLAIVEPVFELSVLSL